MSAITAFLDARFAELQRGWYERGMASLVEGLTEFRLTLPDNAWAKGVLPACRQHRLDSLLLEDPFTRRARERPRGYAGDAVMMDYMYFREPPSPCSDIGQQVFAFLTDSPNAASVRWRREHIASLINAEVRQRKTLSVLGVACGHCREGLLLSNEAMLAISRYDVLDQDDESLEVIGRTLPGHIKPKKLAAQALGEQQELCGFDFVYSAGLYDYLDEPQAAALTKVLVERTAPGGTVLVANFTQDNWGRGYMEAFMNWRLVLRTRDDMRRLVPATGVAGSALYFDPYRNAIYLKIVRA
ncbi:hypothetical protein RTH46_19415 [Pseudomonas sp. zfem004]|uniref:hypothetical protein n=1 Tax=unclassified Pseudomonas TaxID=196821 RepID=UPI00129ABA3E|nr:MULTISPECIES: hypothetical protein [unclassified Pseudomonas]MDU9404657.1 hypothetical protein [Pseudomonas sp. zfem004]